MKNVLVALMVGWCLGLPCPVRCGGETKGSVPPVPAEDYPLYDQAVERLFLTSRPSGLLIERMTVGRLLPNETEPVTVDWFQERNYFMGRLPQELVHDFVHVNREAARLEGRFRFGVWYRFLSDGLIEEPEVLSRRPLNVVCLVEAPLLSRMDRLAFSRIGRTLRNDQSLFYVEQFRPDGTGAGFLVWFRREERNWKILDTEVVWVIRDDPAGEEFP